MSHLPPENIQPTRPQALKRGPLRVAKRLIETFSTNNRQRHASWATKSVSESTLNHIRLITIGSSHYCEKVRWGLDLLEADPESNVYYTEDAHPPVFAAFATMEASSGEASMTPMITYTDENQNQSVSASNKTVLYNSADILEKFCSFLYPIEHREKIRRIETYMGSRLGATVRCYLYHVLFQPHNHEVLVNISTYYSSSIERLLWSRMIKKGLKRGMSKVMGINNDSAASSLRMIRSVFSDISRQLQGTDGNKLQYLMDTDDRKVGFTAADLTFCALAAPLIGPPEVEHWNDLMVTKEILNLRSELRETLAGRHVLEIYRKHRFGIRNIANNSFMIDKDGKEKRKIVLPKTVTRDRLPWRTVLTTGVAVGAGILWQSGDIDPLFKSKL